MTNPAPRATTTDAGIPVQSDEHSLTVGPDGPILLHDHYLIEQMAQFNRERVPERQPHAKGGGAFGRFEVTADVSAYTKAAVFQPDTTTELVIRFSTVAVAPSNLVPGIGPSPDRMLLGRMFAYSDAHRARIGTNYNQLPVNAPITPVHSYSKDGAMRYRTVSDPVYAPNSKGGPRADPERYGEPAGWHTDGEMVRTAYTLRPEDDDWGQAGALVRDVLDDAARARLAGNIVGHLLHGVTEPVLRRAFEYWRNVDKKLGDRIEQGVRTQQSLIAGTTDLWSE
ncbi:catalase [Nocardia sp. NPDC004711]